MHGTGDRGSRVDPARYRALPLRAHDFLADVPLHDVWQIRLRGGTTHVTIREVIDLFAQMDPSAVGTATRTLFALRAGLGRVLGWDGEDAAADEYSYVRRLTADDRARSVDEPGSPRGFWRSVYTFDREALGEIINRTVHAFLLFALEPDGSDATLYWAIYVRPVNRFTPLYMALIDPFRRHVVYPALIRHLEDRWRRRREGAARRT